jgi:hypothetical protein
MTVDFLLLGILVALVSLNVTLGKIAKVLTAKVLQDQLDRTRDEDEDDLDEDGRTANDYLIEALEPATPKPDNPSRSASQSPQHTKGRPAK